MYLYRNTWSGHCSLVRAVIHMRRAYLLKAKKEEVLQLLPDIFTLFSHKVIIIQITFTFVTVLQRNMTV